MRSASGISAKFLFWGLLIATTPLYAQTERVPVERAGSDKQSTLQLDPAAARQLFEEARSLAKKGQYAEACPKFEQSYRRDPGIGTLYNLADCWEHLGRTASAWAKFRDVADEAARTNQPEREQVALRRAEALVLQLSKVVVRVESKDEGLQILRDGVPMISSDYGNPIPLDPGEHWFEATAPGKRSWRATVTVPARGNAVEVVVPPLRNDDRPHDPALTASATAALPAATTSIVPVPSPNAVVTPKSPAPSAVANPVTPMPSATPAGNSSSPNLTDRNASNSTQRTLAYVAGGVGLAAVAAGTYFGIRVWSKNRQIDSICTDPDHTPCTDADRTEYDATRRDAKSARTLALVSFGVGGAALVTSAVLFFATPKTQVSAWQFTPAFSVDSLGAQLRGAF